MSDSNENRQAKRFPSAYIVELDSGTGVTRDLSTAGVCFTTDHAIEPNLMLRCFIPMEKTGGSAPRRLRCEGRVVRIDESEVGWEVAVKFTTFEW
ncbi:MAG: PilZ domain-containing protein [Gammaproteobacteria bacterium]